MPLSSPRSLRLQVDALFVGGRPHSPSCHARPPSRMRQEQQHYPNGRSPTSPEEKEEQRREKSGRERFPPSLRSALLFSPQCPSLSSFLPFFHTPLRRLNQHRRGRERGRESASGDVRVAPSAPALSPSLPRCCLCHRGEGGNDETRRVVGKGASIYDFLT